MEFKRSEIAAIVAAILIPIVILVVIFTPGAVRAITLFVLTSDNLPIVFGSAAAALFGVLVYRVYRRLRPRQPPRP
jgi:hypothetical protein